MGGAWIAVDCRPALIATALVELLRAAIGGKGLRVAVARAFATRCGEGAIWREKGRIQVLYVVAPGPICASDSPKAANVCSTLVGFEFPTRVRQRFALSNKQRARP